MARPAPNELVSAEPMIPVPGIARFPIELTPPLDFDAERLETWPQVEGCLEWVAGRLWYMPPFGDRQGKTVVDLATVLGVWVRSHADYEAGTNEAGMRLGDDTRGADGAVWRRADAGPDTGGLVFVPPVLAAEVAGRYAGEPALREKAHWYLEHGVAVVWLLLPSQREVLVLTAEGDSRHGIGATLPPHPALPGLTPAVADLFWQISRPG